MVVDSVRRPAVLVRAAGQRIGIPLGGSAVAIGWKCARALARRRAVMHGFGCTLTARTPQTVLYVLLCTERERERTSDLYNCRARWPRKFDVQSNSCNCNAQFAAARQCSNATHEQRSEAVGCPCFALPLQTDTSDHSQMCVCVFVCLHAVRR